MIVVNPAIDNSVYLSAMDRQLEAFISSNQLERSLFLDLLFQPAVLVPDIYFFISEPLELMLSGKRTLLECGLEEGLVIPSFRNPKTETFKDALDEIIQGGIQGLLQPIERCSKIAARLDFAVSQGNSFRSTSWPTDKLVAGRYRTLMEGCLTAEEPPWTGGRHVDHDVMRKHWRDSKYWRLDCLERAIDGNNGGLMRGKYMNELAAQLDEEGPIPDVRVILSAGERKFGSGSGRYHALRMVCSVMSNCYIYNQATSQRCVASFPSFDRHVRTVLASIGGAQTPESSPAIEDQSGWPTISQDLSLPVFGSLAAHDPMDLIRIRKDVYPDYWASLKSWQEEPNERNSDSLRTTAEAYTRTLCDRVQGTTDALAVSHRARMAGAALDGIGGVSAIAALGGELGSASGLDVPTALKVGAATTAALIAVGRAGQSIYSWASAKPPLSEVVTREWTARPHQTGSPELNIPSDSV